MLSKHEKRLKLISLLFRHISMALLIVPKQARKLELYVNLNNTATLIIKYLGC